MLLLGAPLADQILQGVAEQLLVAFGPGADVVDQPVGPGHGGSEAGKERRLRRSAEAGGCIERGRASAWNQARLVALAQWALMDSEIEIYWGGLAQ